MLLSLVLVLLLVAGRCSRLEAKTRTETRTGTETRTETRTGTETRTQTRAQTRPGTETRTRTSWSGVRRLERGSRSQQGLEGPPPRHKQTFIQHLTGPLYFNPKCRKHFYRLYHNTRDCTTPDYYRRCARLLTRLAKSSRCTER